MCLTSQTVDHGVLYLGRIPHGFYEVQMKDYFTQFGEVTRVRLSRNKRVRTPNLAHVIASHILVLPERPLQALCLH